MSLASEMYDKYAKNGKEQTEARLKKNIEESLEEIKDAMACGADHCDLYLDWTDLPDDWVVLPETVEYLEDNGFHIEHKVYGGEWCCPEKRYVTITW